MHIHNNFVAIRRTVIIIIIKNAPIKVTLHTKVLQGHFTQLTRRTLQRCGTRGCRLAIRLSRMMTETVTSLNAVERSAGTVHL